jgi:hypothetical protein
VIKIDRSSTSAPTTSDFQPPKITSPKKPRKKTKPRNPPKPPMTFGRVAKHTMDKISEPSPASISRRQFVISFFVASLTGTSIITGGAVAFTINRPITGRKIVHSLRKTIRIRVVACSPVAGHTGGNCSWVMAWRGQDTFTVTSSTSSGSIPLKPSVLARESVAYVSGLKW